MNKSSKNGGIKWKELTNSKMEKSIGSSSRLRNCSKSKKFIPQRTNTVSDLHEKIKNFGTDKMVPSLAEGGFLIEDREISGIEPELPSPSNSANSEESFLRTLRRRDSPLILPENSLHPLNFLKSANILEQSPRSPENNLKEIKQLEENFNRLKKEFVKFKELVQEELCKQSDYLRTSVKNIFIQMHKNMEKQYHQRKSGERQGGNPRVRSSRGSVGGHSSVCSYTFRDSEQDPGRARRSIDTEGGEEIEEIVKKVSNNRESYFDEVFGEFNIKLDNNLADPVIDKLQSQKHQRTKTDYSPEKKQSIFSEINNVTRKREKSLGNNLNYLTPDEKEPSLDDESFEKYSSVTTPVNIPKHFEKLFEAVDSLKKDMNVLKVLSKTVGDSEIKVALKGGNAKSEKPLSENRTLEKGDLLVPSQLEKENIPKGRQSKRISFLNFPQNGDLFEKRFVTLRKTSFVGTKTDR